MNFLLHRKKENPPFRQNKFTLALIRKLQVIQKRAANYLQRKTDVLSGSTKKFYLFLFCMIAITCSMYVMLTSWVATKNDHAIITVIRFPVHLESIRRGGYQTSSKANDLVLRRVQLFKWYMDSLTKTAAGKIVHDSIIAQRPGLMDSLSQIDITQIK